MAYTTIDDPSAHFQTLTYRGNSTSTTTSDRSLTNEGNSDLQPDVVWIGNRDTAINSGMRWWDSSRGVGQNLGLTSSGTNAEGSPNDPEYGYVNSLNTNGFGVRAGSNDSNGRWTVDRGEGGGDKYVAWQWKANGGTTSTNTDGVISSTVQVNSDAGFSLLTYTMGSGNDTVGHGLGVAPEVVITKARFRSDANGFWSVYTTVIDGSLDYLKLNDTTTKANSSLAAPTSTVFTGAGSSTVSYRDFVAYCFTEKQGYSKFGSYKGLLGTTRPVYTGFKPAFILIKCTSAVTHWAMIDTKRTGYNDDNYRLYANLTNAENTTDTNLDIFSNGFRLLTSDSDFNNTGSTYFYMAFAENPFVTSTGIPTTAR